MTPPAINLLWPVPGTPVSGNSFTVQGRLDDDTATASLQYTDTYGMVQTVAGLVERGGNLWFENVPLLAGTNEFSITATDAAGNSSMTNLEVIQSSALLTINAPSADDMNYAVATIYGMVDDPDALITVNGVTAGNYGGYWEADNVPLPPGGTVVLTATAKMADGTSAKAWWKPTVTRWCSHRRMATHWTIARQSGPAVRPKTPERFIWTPTGRAVAGGRTR